MIYLSSYTNTELNTSISLHLLCFSNMIISFKFKIANTNLEFKETNEKENLNNNY